MPRLTKASSFDRWIDQFSDMDLDDQAFALAQLQAIHRQEQRRAAKSNGKPAATPDPEDLPFDAEVALSGG